ncbi:MAG TPA: type II secretion system protein [Coleofasciculaceae cyanobacterium]|jgi:prepilin-type N-terminal cleavage/methylation domain-containing protein
MAGFTLAELLIALAVLGVIATFTIPKVLNAQQNSHDNAIAKEVAGMASGAYTAFKQTSQPDQNTAMDSLLPYFNHIKIDTASVVDGIPGGGAFDCSVVGNRCLVMHSGAVIGYSQGLKFGGTTSLHAIAVAVDPDGKLTGAGGDTGKSVQFVLYFDGRLTTRANALTGTQTSAGGIGPSPGSDPTWFSW